MYIDITGDFLTELTTCHTPNEDLKKENIVARFLAFAKHGKGYDKEHFIKQYNEIGANLLNGQTFEDFIYRRCLYFHSDVLTEYLHAKSRLEEALKYLKKEKLGAIEIRREIKNRLSDEEASEDPEYNKYDYYIKYFADRIKSISEALDEPNLIKCALESAQTPYWAGWQRMGLYAANIFADYAVKNGHDYIWFGMLTVPFMKKMQQWRTSNHNLYVETFAKIIQEYAIVKNMIKICEENYYLHRRLNIVKIAAELFEREEYEAFSYLMAPQTEGMFGDYLKLCNVECENKTGMTAKIEKVKEFTPAGKGPFVEYAYFKYDFPALRNPMAHGAIVEVNQETAFEILMDAHWVVQEINLDEHNYKKWINFLREIASADSGYSIILKRCRSDSWDYKLYIDLLMMWFRGNFDEITDFYRLSNEENILRECLNSAELYNAIWSNMPLQNEDKTASTDDMRVMKWNDEPLLYQDFIETVKENNVAVPKEWLFKYYCFIDTMNKHKEQSLVKMKERMKNYNADYCAEGKETSEGNSNEES